MAHFSEVSGVEILEERCLMAVTPISGGATPVSGAGVSYYISPSGSTQNNGTQNSPWPSVAFALTKVGGGHTFLLEPGNYGAINVPVGYGGTAASPTIIRSQYQWQAIIDGHGADSGFGTEDGVQYVVVDGLQIRNCLYTGIKMNGSNNVIENNWVSHSTLGIVIYYGNGNLIQGNLLEYNGSSYWDGRGIIVGGDHQTITGNVIRHNSSIGIFANLTTNAVISGNLIYDQDARSGIYVYATPGSGNSVTNNTLLDNYWAFENGLTGVQTYRGNVVVSDASTAALDKIISGQVSQYFQVNSAWFSPDTVAPAVSLVSSTENFLDQYMQVTVRYTDNVGIDTSTLGNGDLALSGPGGYSQSAVLKTWTRDATGVLAVYQFRSPGPVWDAQDNGTYTLSVLPGQVADDAGPANFVVAGSMGQVTVHLTDQSIYVSPTGLTTNNGTQSSPLPSVAYALSLVGGGHTIILEPGTYAPIAVLCGFGGTSSSPTVIRSQYKWQAVIDGSLNPAVEGVATEFPSGGRNSDYVTFDGLKIVNAGTFGVKFGGSGDVIVNCWVKGSKLSGIESGDNSTVQNNLIENNGTSPRYDHGIYAGTTGVVIIGNIVRNNSGCGITTSIGVHNSTITGNLVYGQNTEADLEISGAVANSNTIAGNTLLDSAVGGMMVYLNNPVGLWSSNVVEPAIKASSLNSITSNIVADYSAGLSAILPRSSISDRTPPTAKVIDSGIYAGNQMVEVAYTDNVALAPAKINPNNVIIKGPGGYSAPAMSVAYMLLTDSRTLVVMYNLAPPSAGWTFANSGQYSVSLQSNQICDLAGNYSAAGTISGGFSIAIAKAVQPVAKVAAVNTAAVKAPAAVGSTPSPAQTSSNVTVPAAKPSSAPFVPTLTVLPKAVSGPVAARTTGPALASGGILDLLPTLLPLSLQLS